MNIPNACPDLGRAVHGAATPRLDSRGEALSRVRHHARFPAATLARPGCQRGFTLSELMVTIAVLGIPSAMLARAVDNVSTTDAPAVSRQAGAALDRSFGLARRSTATSADAILAGLPPDVRGTMRIRIQPDPTNTCFDANRDAAYHQIIEFLMLQPGGALTVEFSEQLPCGPAVIMAVAPQFDATGNCNIVTCATDGQCYGGSLRCPGSVGPRSTQEKRIPTTFNEPRCYSNGTCDPVTLYFESADRLQQPPWTYSNRKAAFISMSMTGSIIRGDYTVSNQ